MKVNKAITVSFALLSMMALLVPIAFAPSPRSSPIVQQVTGGGWILRCTTYKCTFGFNAEELEDGTLRGNVEYVDHGPFGGYDKGYPHVHGYEITALTINDRIANIEGICRLNGDNTPREFFVHVHDEGEPGKYDVFKIVIPSIDYDSGHRELGFLGDAGGGGNIQIHRPAP